MRILAPQWLWALLILPLIYLFYLWDHHRRRKSFERFAAPAVWASIAPALDPAARLRKAQMWLAAFAFVLLALARPQWGTHDETLKLTGSDILFVLDVSNSMEVEDTVPSRLKKAKHVIRTLVDRLHGDRVGVVAFAASSFVACPLTNDLDYVLNMVEILNPSMVVNQGTDIGIGLETAAKAIQRGAEDGTKKVENLPSSQAIILISDGEDWEQEALEGAKLVKTAGVRFYVLGVGTEKGGPIPVRGEDGILHGYKRSARGEPIISKYDPDALTKLALTGGGRYWNVTDSETEVDQILQDLGTLNRTEFSERRFVVYEDRFQFPLAIGILLMFIELAIPARKILAMIMILLSGASLLISRDARASSLDVYLENQRGLKSFKDGKVDEAKKKFGSAQALDPSQPEPRYNEGVVQAKEGDIEGATQSFADAAKAAAERGNDLLASKSYYNLGAMLEANGDNKGAVKSYLRALNAAKASDSEELETDARKKLEMMVKKQGQKQNQQQDPNQQQKNGGKKDQQSEKDDKQAQNQKPNQGKDEKKDQKPEQGKEPDKSQDQGQQKPQETANGRGNDRFKSDKLNKEDAERVMDQLSSKEKELQAKLKKQHGRPQQVSQKDW